MAQLAIKGHATRGKEVIELLEMLGGRIMYTYNGDDDTAVYFIDGLYIMAYKYKDINCEKFKIFTLEEFIEKFPYKVVDKVVYIPLMYSYSIKEMRWNAEWNNVYYTITNNDGMDIECVSSENLRLCKEENMEGKLTASNDVMRLNIDTSKMTKSQIIFGIDAPNETELVFVGDFEVQSKGGKTFVVRKKSPYPKTYEDCCKVLGYEPDRQTATGYDAELIENFQRLKLCRDAYWKIAGDWKPKAGLHVHYMYYSRTDDFIQMDHGTLRGNIIIGFPTEEMRDAFYENFKDLIEKCKELL